MRDAFIGEVCGSLSDTAAAEGNNQQRKESGFWLIR